MAFTNLKSQFWICAYAIKDTEMRESVRQVPLIKIPMKLSCKGSRVGLTRYEAWTYEQITLISALFYFTIPQILMPLTFKRDSWDLYSRLRENKSEILTRPCSLIQKTPLLSCFPTALSLISLQDEPGFFSVPYSMSSTNWKVFHSFPKQTCTLPFKNFSAPAWPALLQAHDWSPNLKMVGTGSSQFNVSSTQFWPLTCATKKATHRIWEKRFIAVQHKDDSQDSLQHNDLAGKNVQLYFRPNVVFMTYTAVFKQL